MKKRERSNHGNRKIPVLLPVNGSDYLALLISKTMRSILLVLAASILCSVTGPLEAQRQGSEQPRFKAEVYAGLLEVRVTDPSGNSITGLGRADFLVKEDGQPRKIVFFRPAEAVPLSLGILIDIGSTMSGAYVSQARDMVFELIHLLDPEDEILLACYDGDFHLVADLTSDRKELVDGLWNIAARRKQKSFLGDLLHGTDSRTGRAVDFALLEMKRAKHSTKAVLVISAGFGAISVGTLDHLQIAGARFFTISLPNKAGDVLGLGGDQMARRRIVEETGGISYTPEEVAGKLRVLRDGLKKAYLLAYEAAAGEKRAEITVANRPEYRVHFAPRISSTDPFY